MINLTKCFSILALSLLTLNSIAQDGKVKKGQKTASTKTIISTPPQAKKATAEEAKKVMPAKSVSTSTTKTKSVRHVSKADFNSCSEEQKKYILANPDRFIITE